MSNLPRIRIYSDKWDKSLHFLDLPQFDMSKRKRKINRSNNKQINYKR